MGGAGARGEAPNREPHPKGFPPAPQQKGPGMTPEQAESEMLVMSLEFMLPTTSEELLETLNHRGLRHVEGGAPYDAEEHTGKPLSDLIDSTWQVTWLNGSTAWTATNSESGDVITYLEGDVYARPYAEVTE